MAAQHIINNIEFSRNSLKIHDTIRRSNFRRIADLLASEEVLIDWSLEGKPSNATAKPKLVLNLNADLMLVCQRCLKPISTKIEIHQVFSLSDDEMPFSEIDSDDDFIGFSTEFDILNLIEDELVLALPYAPVHNQVCIQSEVLTTGESNNPFGKLKNLKF